MNLRGDGKVRSVPTTASVLQRVRTVPRSAPVTLGLVTVLAFTSYWLAHANDPDQILESASTNVHNLTHMPLRSFVMSAVVLSGGGWLIASIELMLSAGLLERGRGSVAMLKVFASGHVIATLLTEGGVAAGIAFGILPRHDLRMIDVGVSYGMYACATAALVLLPKWWRVAGGSLIGLSVLIPLALDPGMTPIGHVTSVLVGLAWWPQLLNVKVPTPRDGRRLRVPSIAGLRRVAAV
jgi:hypothetical protein